MTWYIVGAGASGLAAARLTSVKNIPAVLIDQNSLSDETKSRLSSWGVAYKEQVSQDFFPESSPAGVILSPGVPCSHPFVQRSKGLSIPVMSETDFGLQYFKGECLAVTGTNGKSTTVTLINHLVNQSGIRSLLAGNIGTPVCELIAAGASPDWLVLELSSYQLEQASERVFKAGLFLNFSEDHLQRHGTLKQYFHEKWKLFHLIRPGGLFFAPVDVCQRARAWGFSENPSVTLHELDWNRTEDLKLPKQEFFSFEHNRKNTLASLEIAQIATRTSTESLSEYLYNFSGLSHRCELVYTHKQRRFINDSKATNVDSTMTALSSMDSPLILMLGGQGKGESFLPLMTHESRVSYLVTFGPSGKAIADELTWNKPHRHFETLKSACDALHEILSSQPGNLLLSPGCASFDEFKNFEERGEFFRQSIQNLFKDTL